MKQLFFFLMIFVSVASQAQNWTTNFQNAQAEAKSQHKNILLVFSGSDWCAPCIKLEKNVFSSEVFKSESQQWVLVKADFPKKKNNALPENLRIQNEMLAEQYNKDGNFPFVIVLDENGKVLGRTGYKNVSSTEYVNELKSFTLLR